jgi:GNAT superfamily N-acetyltransferase
MSGRREFVFEERRVSTTPACIRDYLALFHVFRRGHLYTESYLRWEYDENPEGKAIGFDAWDGETLAGHYVTQPMRARLDGREHRGLLSLNTATNPQHQGKGLFTTLAQRTYAAAADEGYAFVIGVANEKSTHGLVKHLGFTLLGPLEAHVGLGHPPMTTRETAIAYERVWSDDALRWRTRNPARPYFTVHHGSSSTVLAKTEYRGLMGVLTDDATASAAPDASAFTRALPRLWLGVDARLDFRRAATIRLPVRLRPSPLNLIFRALRDDVRVPRREEIAFSLIDFDIL